MVPRLQSSQSTSFLSLSLLVLTSSLFVKPVKAQAVDRAIDAGVERETKFLSSLLPWEIHREAREQGEREQGDTHRGIATQTETESDIQGRGDAGSGGRPDGIQTGIETLPELEPLNPRFSGGLNPLDAPRPDTSVETLQTLRVTASPRHRVISDEVQSGIQTPGTGILDANIGTHSAPHPHVPVSPRHFLETEGISHFSLPIQTAQVPNPTTPPVPLPQQQLPQLPDRPEPPSQAPLETPAPAPLPPPEQLLAPPTSPPTPEPIPGKVPATISVERFEFEGNTAISDEELAEVTKPFTGKPITFAELFQARSAVTELYIRRGYITSGALIPPQTLERGVVTIQVVEGGLESINITGTRRLNPNYVRSRIAIATEKPLNRDRLLEALQLLQLNPLIQNLSAELSAGTEPGSSALEVRVTEAKTFNTQLSLDNSRPPSVGTDRRRIQLSEANLLGLGDGISLSYSNTNGSNAWDVSYTLPTNPRNGTLRLSYGRTSSEVIESPFDRLDIEADSRYYELTLRQPLLQTPTQEFAFGVTATRQESETTLLGIPLALSPGADARGRTRISALRFFQEWTKRSSREVIAARSQFSVGIGAFDATINNDPPHSRFVAWRGQAQWVRLLAPDTLLLVRGDLQVADRALVPLEQFSLGGQQTIRGYRQDLLLTDNGVLGSAELRFPILRIPRWNTLLQLAPFIDLGGAWNNSGRPDPDPGVLASLGLGLQLQVSDRISARLDYGVPLVSVDTNKRTWQEHGFYFSIIVNPF